MMAGNFKPPSSIRRAAEALLGPIVVRRRLPDEIGGAPIVVSGRVGGLKYLLKTAGEWDPELLKIARDLVARGNTVWDIGANVGLFSRAAAFHAGAQGSVIAIEPDLDAAALLNRSRRHHSVGHAPIVIVPVAISDRVGFVRFSIAKRARSSNAIEGFGSTQTGGTRELRTLPCATLDSLLESFPPPDVLKVDVEEAELLVLRGGDEVLRNVRPVIYCEIAKRTFDEVRATLEGSAYKLWDGSGFKADLSGPGVSRDTVNLVAIPTEKITGFHGRR